MSGLLSRRSRFLVLVALAGALALLAGACGSGGNGPEAGVQTAGGEQVSDYRGGSPPEGQELPRFSLRTHEGRPLSQDDLAGKVVLLTFLDAQCKESCPLIATQLARGLERLEPPEREDVMAVAISTHPHGDTPATVSAFLRRQRAEGAVTYLLGTEEELRPVWEQAQILASLDSGHHDLHSAPVRVYGRDGIWAATLHAGADLSSESLAHDARLALRST